MDAPLIPLCDRQKTGQEQDGVVTVVGCFYAEQLLVIKQKDETSKKFLFLYTGLNSKVVLTDHKIVADVKTDL